MLLEKEKMDAKNRIDRMSKLVIALAISFVILSFSLIITLTVTNSKSTSEIEQFVRIGLKKSHVIVQIGDQRHLIQNIEQLDEYDLTSIPVQNVYIYYDNVKIIINNAQESVD